MNKEDIIITNTISFVKSKLHGDCTGHDWWHIYRVWKMAVYLSVREGGNKYIIQLAALLHDVADWKFNNGSESIGVQKIKEWLTGQNVDNETIIQVCEIIEKISFKGAGVAHESLSLEGKIVQDADRLDALGAIGIARTFAYGGAKGREMHNPEIKPVLHQSFDDYKNKQSTTINHFYEKLLLLKDQMNTATAQHLAIKRHHFLDAFLNQFQSEWKGL
jgi:uncharacterized protein